MTGAFNGINGGLNQIQTQYTNLMNGIDSIDNFSSSLGATDLGFNPMMSLNGSLFGGGFGYGTKAMEIYNSQTPEEALNYQLKMQGSQIVGNYGLNNLQMQTQARQKIDQAKINAATEFASTAPENVVTRQIGVLQRQIKNNEQNHIKAEYDNLLNRVRDSLKEAGYTNVDENQIKAHAEKLYYEASGKDIITDLQEHGNNEFVQGLTEGVFGLGLLFNSKSSKDNISDITGEAVSGGDQVQRWAGRIIAGGAAILGIIALAKHGGNPFKAVGNLSKSLSLNSAEKAITKAAKLDPSNTRIIDMEAALIKRRDAFNAGKAQDSLRKAERRFGHI